MRFNMNLFIYLHNIKYRDMNKALFFTLLLSVILTTSCGNATEKSDSSNVKSEEIANKIVPEHLTLETFKEKIWDFDTNSEEWTYKGTEPCIIDFYADWCGPCKIIAPIMEELAAEYEGKIKIYKIDTDDERELASAFGIRSIPSVLFSPLKGKPMMKTGALSKEAYVKIIEEQLLIKTQE